MPVAAVNQVAVDFIGADDHLVPQANLRHRLQFILAEDAPAGVVRIAEHEDARLRGDRRLEGIQVYLVLTVCPAGEFHFLLGETRVPRHAEEWPVSGGLHQHALPGAGERLRRQIEAGHHPRDEDQPFGVHLPPVAAGEPAGHGLVQPLRGIGVTENPVIQPRLQGIQHPLRGGEIHIRHPHGQHIFGEGVPFFALAGAAVNDGVEIEGLSHSYLFSVFSGIAEIDSNVNLQSDNTRLILRHVFRLACLILK